MTVCVPTKSEIIRAIQNRNRHERESSGRKERDIIDIYAEEKLQLSDSDYQNLCKEYTKREESWREFFGDNRYSLDFVTGLEHILTEVSFFVHVLTTPAVLRYGIAADI